MEGFTVFIKNLHLRTACFLCTSLRLCVDFDMDNVELSVANQVTPSISASQLSVDSRVSFNV